MQISVNHYRFLRGDLLGDLAEVFNDMRDKLQSTTISRDYVDSVLSQHE